jgi:hypothetical protein
MRPGIEQTLRDVAVPRVTQRKAIASGLSCLIICLPKCCVGWHSSRRYRDNLSGIGKSDYQHIRPCTQQIDIA